MLRRSLWLLMVAALAGCGAKTSADDAGGGPGLDAGTQDAGNQDAGVTDGGVDGGSSDAGPSAEVPGSPTQLTATPMPGGTVSLSWQPPLDAGSSPVSGYAIASTPAGASATTAALSYATPALSIGTAYTFGVSATNDAGTGSPAVSGSVVAGDVPGAPTVTATAPSGRISVTWTAAPENGYPVTGYTVTTTPPGPTASVNGGTFAATLIGVNKGTTYTANVVATNALGAGPAGLSNQVTASCTNTTRTLQAIDSASVEYGMPVLTTPDGNVEATRDDRVWNSDRRGWAKFDLSPFPLWAKVTSLNLTLDAAAVNLGTTPPAVLEIWYSQDTGWTRNSIPQPSDIRPTLAVSAQFLSGSVGSQSFGIAVGLRDWSGDIAAGLLTLGIRNVSTVSPPNWSSNIYYGSDNNPYGSAPTLTVIDCE